MRLAVARDCLFEMAFPVLIDSKIRLAARPVTGVDVVWIGYFIDEKREMLSGI